jgi:hypothetical protein
MAQVDEGLRFDRAFEVQVQFGFGQAADVGALVFGGLQGLSVLCLEFITESTERNCRSLRFAALRSG